MKEDDQRNYNLLLWLQGAVKVSIATATTVEDVQFDTVEKELEVYSEGFIVGNHYCNNYILQGLCKRTELCDTV